MPGSQVLIYPILWILMPLETAYAGVSSPSTPAAPRRLTPRPTPPDPTPTARRATAPPRHRATARHLKVDHAATDARRSDQHV